jgi:Cobalamin biosynthesis protein CobN and related Mg-chelatases
MANSTRMSTIQAQKARKQKKIAIVGGVILLALLVFLGPRTLKSLHGGSSSSAPYVAVQPTAATASSATTPTSATPIAAAAAVAVTASLVDSDRPPAHTKSQLVSFDTFDSKDPFVQQVTDAPDVPAVSTTAPATAPSGAATTAAPATTGGATASASSSSSTTASTSGSQPTRSTAAVVEVNGERQSIGVAQTFPTANPTFRLVSIGNGVAKIGLAGGTYASGAPTVSLRLGRTLTLVNTADGVRYELRLVSAQ